jgi:hypothetical protein
MCYELVISMDIQRPPGFETYFQPWRKYLEILADNTFNTLSEHMVEWTRLREWETNSHWQEVCVSGIFV